MKLKVTAPKITINGIKKISLNRSKEFAVGIAGTYADHPYMSTVEACDDLRASFEAVTTHASRYNFDADKKPIMQGGCHGEPEHRKLLRRSLRQFFLDALSVHADDD